VGSGLYQCFWGYALAQGGQLASKGVDTVTIEVSTAAANAIVASGNFFAQLSCDVDDTCLSDGNLGAPATRIEYTLANDNDFYDVSYINGMNVPAVMTPAPSTALAYDASDPYRCMAAGGDATTLQSIASFQQKHGIAGNTQLQPFACTNDYDATYVGELVGLNFVSPPATNPPSCTDAIPTCASAADCGNGQVCGLSLDAVKGQNCVTQGQLTCGQRLGYWSYTQLCSASASFSSPALGVNCSDAQTLAYALCTDQPGLSDQGPGRSCFNSNTTTKGETCCGFEAWSFGGKPQPIQVGHSAVSGVDTTFWATNILPLVKTTKAGCPLAYSYQFDDPYSTFTCATQAAPNMASYAITLCPNGDAAGVDPPPPPTCTPTVPAGNGADQFFVGFDSNDLTIEVDACDATGSTCTTPVSPTAGDAIFTTTAASRYRITAKSSMSNTQQACQLIIPASGCITRAGDFSQPPCSLWQVQTDGAWAGRGISVPTF
jgi:hypothetical protein